MRVRLVLGAALVAVAAAACGTSPTTGRSNLLDRAPTEAVGPSVTSSAPSAPPTVHATTGASRPSAPPTHLPPVKPALPVGTISGAPGHPVPLPAGAVALTFDDGPDPQWTPQVLAILAQHHAKATFFDIGIWAQKYPSLVRAEYAGGHGVGNHTWTHVDLTRYLPDVDTYQVAKAAAAIEAADGHAPVCLRPPYDAIDPAVENTVGQQREALMLYDVDPRDWQQPGTATIVQRVLAGAHPGAVIDLHDAGGNRAQTVAALPQILDGLAARHLTTVPICRS